MRERRLKEWQHFAFIDGRYFVSVALFDAKRRALAHVAVYDREKHERVIVERRLRSCDLEVPATVWDSQGSVDARGLHIQMHNDLERGGFHVEFFCDRSGKRPEVQGVFEAYEPLDWLEPLTVCLPLERGRAMFSHKAVLPMDGRLRVGKETHVFSREEGFALPDIHKGYYPYVMKWHWATGGGRNRFGRMVGFNLTNNQVRDQEAYNENCLWVDGKACLLPPVTFVKDPRQPYEPWLIRDAGDRVNVRFFPEMQRDINLNLLVLRSKYHGPYGRFTGFILDAAGQPVDIEHCYGMAEDFYLRG
jgi:hypothetical protein